MSTSTEELRCPIGEFRMPESVDAVEIPVLLDDMARLPDDFRRLVEGFDQARLAALRGRWVPWLRTFGAREWEREIVHPEAGAMRPDTMHALYAWHGRHHMAQIESLARREGWGERNP